MKCRACKNSTLYKFLDLGYHPPSDQFRKKEQLHEPVIFYPLDVYLCESCGFVQLGYVVSPEILYQDDYPYESSMTKAGQKHFWSFADSVVDEYNFSKEDFAVDIGSNVGVLLEGFKIRGLKILGVDPASNICDIAIDRGIPSIADFFTLDVAHDIVQSHGEASIITGTNVFAHIDDLDSLVQAVKFLMHKKKGVFIIEAPHFLHLIKSLEYDTIYHEHLSYLSIKPLISFFDAHGLEIIKVDHKDIHGGSIRIHVSFKNNYSIHSSVKETVDMENEARLFQRETLDLFALGVNQNRDELTWLLKNLKRESKRIVAVSAPAKGMTLLNYCKIGRETLDYVTEKSTLKIGRFTPGDHIPVFPDSKLLEDMPDYALILAWNFSSEIMENLKEYKARGGKFIIPIPKPMVI